MRSSTRLTPTDSIIAGSCIVLMFLTLGAVGQTGRNRAKEVVCLSNTRQLSLAWRMYAEDNNGKMVGGGTGIRQWVDNSLSGMANVQQKQAAVERGLLFPYVGKAEIYHCPADPRNANTQIFAFCTFSIPGGANGGSWKVNSEYTTATKYDDLDNPATRYVFVEEIDTRGYNEGSWQLNLRSRQWVDPLSMWHDKRTVLGFADGHAQVHAWKDSSLIDWCQKAMSDSAFAFYMTPPADQQEDLNYMIAGFPCKRSTGE